MSYKKYIPVLSIAGSDSSGGAGIQADIKTMSALGTYAMTAITAITAQNTTGVTAIEQLSPAIVEAQIDTVYADITPLAIKIGMLGTDATAHTVYTALRRHKATNIVLDPVLKSTSGSTLSDDDAIGIIMTELMPLCTVATPNLTEARRLTGIMSDTPERYSDSELRHIASCLLQTGAGAIVITGVKSMTSPGTLSDIVYTPEGAPDGTAIRTQEISTSNTHGTGCTLSSAIASYLARGYNVMAAIAEANNYVHRAISSGMNVATGKGHGPVNHFFNPISTITI